MELQTKRLTHRPQGCSNARNLFGMTRTPSDNHIRNLLDPVPPGTVFPVFADAVEALHELGHLQPYRSINGDLLMAGTMTNAADNNREALEVARARSAAHKLGRCRISAMPTRT